MSTDFYATDEDEPVDNGALLPIVEVPSESSTSHNESVANGDDTHRSSVHYHESPAEEDGDDDEGSLSADSEPTANISPHRNTRRKRKSRNGMQAVDMTPPDRRLRQTEKRAEKYRQQNKPDSAIRELIRCTALTKIVYGDGHWKLARSHVELAKAYFDLKGYMAQAEYHAEHAKSITMTSVQLSSSTTDRPHIIQVLLDTHYVLAKALTALKKYSSAEVHLSRAEKISDEFAKLSSVTDEQIDGNHMKVAMAFAKLSAHQKKYAVSATYFEKALASTQLAYGDDSVALIPVYQGLGKVEQSRGDRCNHEKAIEYFLQAHSISTARYKGIIKDQLTSFGLFLPAYSSNSVQLAGTGMALAIAYANVGTDEAEMSAESYLNECLVIYQSLYGAQHQKTIQVGDELARLMVRAHRPEEAIDILQSAVGAKMVVYGELSEEVADTWKLIGSIHISQSETEKGVRALKKCHNIQCMVEGSNNKKSKDTQRTLDLLLANPHIAAKERSRQKSNLNQRPRFSSIVNRGTSLGGQKSQL